MNHVRILLLSVVAATACTAEPGPQSQTEPAAATTPPAVSHALTPPTPTTAEAGAEPTAAHHSEPTPVASDVTPKAAIAPAPFREITIPAGTTISLQLGSVVSSTASNVEDAVDATVRRAVVVDGVTVIPAGAAVTGHVTEVERSGKVKGRARVGVRFNAVRVAGTRYTIHTGSIAREAPGTKKTDAARVGIGAGAGAVVGAIAGGKKGAAIGTAVGAAGGTGVVLATRGEEVSMGRGSTLTARLSEAVTVRVR
jgi:hypothetical protein